MQQDVINQLSSRQVNPQMYDFQLTVSFLDYTYRGKANIFGLVIAVVVLYK